LGSQAPGLKGSRIEEDSIAKMALRNVAMRALLLLAVVSVAYAAKGKEKKKESADGPAASGPGGEYDITKLGAKPDGTTDCTEVRTC
jgi:galacturan 1,4-alpha-galacturonidase